MKKIAIVTGANTGLGFQTTQALVKADYHVIMACRDKEKAINAMTEITQLNNDIECVEFMQLDLEDLNSVSSFVELFSTKYTHLDLLVNNAGVMMPPYTLTSNNQELQFAINHLGHFKLTGLLIDILSNSKNPRVVVISSLAHRGKNATINFNDINFSSRYVPFTAYSQSKLANAMFGLDMSEKYPNIKTIICHPGVSDTDLSRHFNKKAMWLRPLVKFMLPISSPKQGAESIIYSCLDQEVLSGDYIGPSGFREWSGKPKHTKLSSDAQNKELRKKLWELSSKITNIRY
jgi:NAD(P)-dependent dehydrogenase (short-subunit alcohol dehydrogenase family)